MVFYTFPFPAFSASPILPLCNPCFQSDIYYAWRLHLFQQKIRLHRPLILVARYRRLGVPLGMLGSFPDETVPIVLETSKRPDIHQNIFDWGRSVHSWLISCYWHAPPLFISASSKCHFLRFYSPHSYLLSRKTRLSVPLILCSGVMRWIQTLSWPGLEAYNSAARQTLTNPDTQLTEGFVKAHDRLYWILGAGHTVSGLSVLS